MVSESCKKRRVKVEKKRSIAASTSKLAKRLSFRIYRSHKGDECAKCNTCRIDIGVARGGKNDLTKHVTSKNHKKSIAAKKRNQRITTFLVKGPEESDKLMQKQNLQCS